LPVTPEALARRGAPALLAATLAAVYVAVSPPSADLPAQLFRTELFRHEGFILWNNLWYSGHDLIGYSVLFPALAALLTPQLAAALAATGTAALFEPLARRHFGPDAWLGATVFAAATAVSLFTGRLTLAFGALPAMGAVLALDRGALLAAVPLAALSALCSPVAALFAALAAAGHAAGRALSRRSACAAAPGLATAAAAALPVVLIAVAFPEGGREPFALSTLWPLVIISAGALIALPRERIALRSTVTLYTAAVLIAFLVPTPVGSNVARLGTATAATLAALLWWPRRRGLLCAVAIPLLYVAAYPPVRDVVSASGDPAAGPAYFRPLLRFLHAQAGPPFRIEIPFTASHYEAYAVALQFPLARGWERQLDIADNPIFYTGRPLIASAYEHWLHARAVRFVALPSAPLDYSARAEAALIRHGLPDLRPVLRSPRWSVFAVKQPTPLLRGPARLLALTPDSVKLTATRPGALVLAVHFSPYWALSRGHGCVSTAGQDTRLTLTAAGSVTLSTEFALDRVGASAPRCRH
jgi:hypothetical protein